LLPQRLERVFSEETGSNSKAMAVVMVVGDADAPVKRLRDALVQGITSVQLMD
jgi:hypothetical protein